MEKKLFSRLTVALILAIVVSIKLNAKVICSSGYMCENKNKYYVAEINNGNFRTLTNSSKTFCGVKTILGIHAKTPIGGNMFCGCIHRIGSEVNLATKANTNENINNENSNFLKRGFYTTSKILAGIWSIWGAWNNINAGFNYFGNEILGDINIDFVGVL